MSSLWKPLSLLAEVNSSMESLSGMMHEFSKEAPSALSRGEFIYEIIEQQDLGSSLYSWSSWIRLWNHQATWCKKLLPLLAEVNSSMESSSSTIQEFSMEAPSALGWGEFINGITERHDAGVLYGSSFRSWSRWIRQWNHRAARRRSSLWKRLLLLVKVIFSIESPGGVIRGIPAKKLVDWYTNNWKHLVLCLHCQITYCT